MPAGCVRGSVAEHRVADAEQFLKPLNVTSHRYCVALKPIVVPSALHVCSRQFRSGLIAESIQGRGNSFIVADLGALASAPASCDAMVFVGCATRSSV
jgi:hypothetical protein